MGRAPVKSVLISSSLIVLCRGLITQHDTRVFGTYAYTTSASSRQNCKSPIPSSQFLSYTFQVNERHANLKLQSTQLASSKVRVLADCVGVDRCSQLSCVLGDGLREQGLRLREAYRRADQRKCLFHRGPHSRAVQVRQGKSVRVTLHLPL